MMHAFWDSKALSCIAWTTWKAAFKKRADSKSPQVEENPQLPIKIIYLHLISSIIVLLLMTHGQLDGQLGR